MNNIQSGMPKANILIVDDTPANLRMLTEILKENGYKVRAAPNGKLALKAAESNPPDLVLLDIRMPGMDGYAVCSHLKTDERTRDIPVIFLSALSEATDKVKAFSVGGVDYVTKPFQAIEVLARVETHLSVSRLQKGLERQIAELDAFGRTVAHDLKGPLGLLIGYSDMLSQKLRDSSDRKVHQYVETIERTGYKMVTIVEELLLLARVRKMDEINLIPLDMASVITEVRERFAAMITKLRVEIIIPDQWPWALSYAPWIEEVWSNYISNAIKYGGLPPRVELGSELTTCENTDRPMIRFFVRDNGPGLTQEEQDRLFTEFTRLHQVRAKGEGLGLSIVRRIIEKLGGEVGVESTVGQGSLFYFTLPAVSGDTSVTKKKVSEPEIKTQIGREEHGAQANLAKDSPQEAVTDRPVDIEKVKPVLQELFTSLASDWHEAMNLMKSLETLLASSALQAEYENLKQETDQFETHLAQQRIYKIARILEIEVIKE